MKIKTNDFQGAMKKFVLPLRRPKTRDEVHDEASVDESSKTQIPSMITNTQALSFKSDSGIVEL